MGRFSRAARQGDGVKGRCDALIHSISHNCDHKLNGICNGESNNVFINGLPAQKVGDNVTFTTCRHGSTGTISEGSETVFINGQNAARIKDLVTCSNGVCRQEILIMQGSDDVFIGD